MHCGTNVAPYPSVSAMAQWNGSTRRSNARNVKDEWSPCRFCDDEGTRPRVILGVVMKFKMILSATLALTVSSTAIASSKVGQVYGEDVDHLGTQCVRQEKAQSESKSGHNSGDSDSDQGRAANGRSAS